MTESTNSVYDDLDVGAGKFKPGSAGEYIDILSRKIQQEESSQHRNKDGSPRVGLIYTGVDTNGAEHEVGVWSARFKKAVLVDRPEVGDFTRFQFDGEEPMPGGLAPAKNWTVNVLRRKGEVELDEAGFPVDY